ncbi:MAG TPA: hemolysin family protein [Rariglobus sp.]|jgi:CBS domain containing-hemolysin-like protein|nr:hemolysin family protein [Rariglobus sp.]
MFWFVVAIVFTFSLSFVCSLMEALILSTSVIEIETLKKSRPKRGLLLEQFKVSLDETISTILTLNTIAITLGSIIIGGLATKIFGEASLGTVSAILTLTILIFAEVLPKNLGVSYRRALQPHIVYPLAFLRNALRPITYLCNVVVRFFIRSPQTHHTSDEEIILLAERGALEGSLTKNESTLIANALALDNVRVSEIMTPRSVVTALRKHATVGEVFLEFPNVPFARIPVYGRNLDEITGIVRRRDLLKAKASNQDTETVEKLMQEIHFIPETVTAANALQVFLKTHQQLLVVVDEFGLTAGVVTMEDVMEQLLGREIFEKDDLAVDMRELARAKLQKQSRPRKSGDTTPTPPPPPSLPPKG